MTQSSNVVYETSKTSIRGTECFAHHWNISLNKEPKSLSVIFHGFLAHGNYPTVRYAAEFLAEAGHAVVAVDIPGHGQSGGKRGYLESADTVVKDGSTIVKYALSLYNAQRPSKLFLVGSSMGGAIALSVAQELPKEDVTGVVLLAPMLKLNVTSLEYYALKCLAFVLPTFHIIPSSATSSEKQYRDVIKRQECDEDGWTVSGAQLQPASALACVEIAQNIRNSFKDITTNFLIMVAEEDVVVKNEGSEELFDRSPSSDKSIKHYPALHGLLCEPSPLFEEIKEDILRWMNERV